MSKKNRRNMEKSAAAGDGSGWETDSSGPEGKLVKSIRYIFWSLFLVPFINWPGFFYPYVFTKVMLFHLLIEAMACLYLILIARDRSFLPRLSLVGPDGRRTWNWLLVLPTAYVTIAGVTSLFGVNRYMSFWGSINFVNGWLILIHFLAMSFILAGVFRREGQWRNFWRLSVLAGLAMSAFALFQGLRGDNPVMATFGNPGHLSGYLIFIFFQACMFWLREKDSEWRYLSAITMLLSAGVILFLTDISGSVLGLAAGLAAMVWLYAVARPQVWLRRAAWGALLIAFIVGAAYAANFLKSGRLENLSGSSYTIKTRLIAWEAGLKGFRDRPWTGYGLENFVAPFERYFQATYYNPGNGGRATEYGLDLPHNKIVEVASCSGIFGLISFLAIFGFAFRQVYVRYRDSQDKSHLAMGGLLVGYLVHSAFLFDNAVTFFLFYATLAYLAAGWRPEAGVPAASGRTQEGNQFVVSGAIVVLAISWWTFVINPVRANLVSLEAMHLAEAGKYVEAAEALKELARRDVYFVQQKAIFETSRSVQSGLSIKSQRTSEEMVFLEEFIRLLEINFERNQYNQFYAIRLASFYNVAGSNDPQYLKKSVELMQGFVDRGSQRMEAYIVLADAYTDLGQKDKVPDLAARATALDPSYGFAYYLFGGVYFRQEEFARAAEMCAMAIEKGYANKDSYGSLAVIQTRLKDYPAAIAAYREQAKFNPNDPQSLTNIALLYLENKQYDEARRAAEEVKKKFPQTAPKIDELLKKIQSVK